MDPEEQKAVLEQMNIQQEIRHKKINEIPDEKFPMDYHMFEIFYGEGRVSFHLCFIYTILRYIPFGITTAP